MTANTPADQVIYVTRTGVQQLKSRLESLEGELAQKTLEMGEIGRADFDLRENRHFMNLRTEVSYGYPQRIAELKEVLRTALVAEDTDQYQKLPEGTVWIGCSVLVSDAGSHDETYTILGWGEVDLDQNIISYSSPIAQALLGKRVGESVTFRGRLLKIVEVCKVLG